MRKILLLMFALAVLLAGCTNGKTYALATVVIDVDRQADAVTVEDFNGNSWTFCGAEDWDIGDCAALTMNDNGTGKIADDTIESATYSGWTLNR